MPPVRHKAGPQAGLPAFGGVAQSFTAFAVELALWPASPCELPAPRDAVLLPASVEPEEPPGLLPALAAGRFSLLRAAPSDVSNEARCESACDTRTRLSMSF